MTYFVERIRAEPSPFRFSAAIDVAASSMSEAQRMTAYKRAGRGVAILETEFALDSYLVAYGEMHVAKLRAFLPNVPFAGDEIAIVDWGCGQGLAAAVTLEFLRGKYPGIRATAVRLVEISNAARARAVEIVSRYANASDVRPYDWNVAAIADSKLDLPPGIPVLHLFSNILDVVPYAIPSLAEIVQAMSEGRRASAILCVGPKACSASPVSSFYRCFTGQSLLAIRDRCVPVPSRYYPFPTCTCYGLVFTIPCAETAAPVAPPLPEVRFYPEDLFVYAAAGMAEEVQTILAAGVDVNSADETGTTSLHLAAKYGAHEVVQILLAAGAKPDVRNTKGATPLYFAAKYGEEQCLSLLVSAGASLDVPVPGSGLTPYLAAAKYGRTSCAKILADAGCDTTACDARGRDAIRLAAYFSGKGDDNER